MASKRNVKSLAALAAGLAILAMALVFYLQTHVFKEEAILETTQTLIAGQPITASDLRAISVPASVAVHGINASYAADIIAHWSPSLPIPAGSILATTSISIHHPKGDITVYITPTDMPPNASPGDTVDLLAPSPTAQNSQTELPADIPIATDVPIIDILPSSSGSSVGIEVALPPSDVSTVAAAQAADHIAVVFSSPGQPRIPIPSYAAPVATPTPSNLQG